jgi:hypothetical protein
MSGDPTYRIFDELSSYALNPKALLPLPMVLLVSAFQPTAVQEVRRKP